MNRIELVLMAIILGSSAVSWLVKTLKQQAEIRRSQQNAERQRVETLRTGRIGTPEPPGAPEPITAAPGAQTPEERLREIMMERQRRLEELRRRAQAQADAKIQANTKTQADARARAQAKADSHAHGPRPLPMQSRPGPVAGPVTRGAGDFIVVIGPDGQPRRVRRSDIDTARRQAPVGRSTVAGAANDRKQQDRLVRKRAEQAREAAAAKARNERNEAEQAAAERQTAASMAAQARQPAVIPGQVYGDRSGAARDRGVPIRGGLSGSELRRAIVLSEILSSPRSLRPEE